MEVRDTTTGKDVFCVYSVDPDTGSPKCSYTNTDIALNNVPGVSGLTFSGVRAALSDAIQQVIQPVATTLAAMAGVPMTIQSTSAADVGVVVRVSGLGPNGAFLAPFLATLNGVTPVLLGTLSRINSLYRISGDIAGNVTVNNGAAVHGFMEIGAHLMRSATYTIPAGYRAVIQAVICALTKAGGVDTAVTFSLRMKPMASNVFGPIIDMSASRDGNSQIQVSQEYSGGTLGPVDVQIVGIASAPGCDVQAYVSGLLVNGAVHP